MSEIFSVLAGLLLLATTSFATGVPAPSGYALNPALIADCSPSPAAKDSPLRIVAAEDGAAVHLVTRASLIPYVGAGLESPSEGLDSLTHGESAEDDYHLEAGIACPLDAYARLNVGYRFDDPLPTLTGSQPDSHIEPENDLRISFDLRLPF
jgi:hypothetical protein